MKTMTKTISGWMRKGLLHFKKKRENEYWDGFRWILWMRGVELNLTDLLSEKLRGEGTEVEN